MNIFIFIMMIQSLKLFKQLQKCQSAILPQFAFAPKTFVPKTFVSAIMLRPKPFQMPTRSSHIKKALTFIKYNFSTTFTSFGITTQLSYQQIKGELEYAQNLFSAGHTEECFQIVDKILAKKYKSIGLFPDIAALYFLSGNHQKLLQILLMCKSYIIEYNLPAFLLKTVEHMIILQYIMLGDQENWLNRFQEVRYYFENIENARQMSNQMKNPSYQLLFLMIQKFFYMSESQQVYIKKKLEYFKQIVGIFKLRPQLKDIKRSSIKLMLLIIKASLGTNLAASEEFYQILLSNFQNSSEFVEFISKLNASHQQVLQNLTQEDKSLLKILLVFPQLRSVSLRFINLFILFNHYEENTRITKSELQKHPHDFNVVLRGCHYLHCSSVLMRQNHQHLVEVDKFIDTNLKFQKTVWKNKDFFKMMEIKETLANQKSIIESKSFLKNQIQLYLFLADHMIRYGQYQKAIEYLRILSNVQSLSASVNIILFKKAQCYTACGDYQKTIKECEAILQKQRDLSQICTLVDSVPKLQFLKQIKNVLAKLDNTKLRNEAKVVIREVYQLEEAINQKVLSSETQNFEQQKQ